MTGVFRSLATVTVLALIAPAGAQAEVPNYKLGDVATQEVITPVALTVIDPVGTEKLREKEGLRVPVVVRFHAQAADEAETALRASFTEAQTNLMDALYRTMKGKPDAERAIGGELFQRAVESTRRRAQGFPLLDELAPIWARGESDDGAQKRLAFPLRTVMSHPIIAGKAPSIFNSKNSVNLVPVNQLTGPPAPQAVEQLGRRVKGSELYSLAAARSELLRSFKPEEQASARFIARFLATNALVDVDLTLLLRARRTAGLSVMDTYQPAEAVVKSGQLIDHKTLAALSALREKTAIGTLQQQLEQKSNTPAPDRYLAGWIIGGFSVVVSLLALILWRIRARETVSLLPVPRRSGATAFTADLAWRERALVAEEKAEQARRAVRSGVLLWMRDKVVHGLFKQRSELLSTQQHAETEMRALERRLEQLHAPLQDRIAAYEKRVAELEKELALKGAEHIELIKAKISLARHQLSVERSRSDRLSEN